MQVKRRRSGFTLIELLIVVVIIGILAAIAIPKFQNTKGKAYVGAMKSDLRNLAVAEEGYFFENQTYTTNLAALRMSNSSGVVLTVQTADAVGWGATATHPMATPLTCYLFVGGAPHGPIGPATTSGTVTCQ